MGVIFGQRKTAERVRSAAAFACYGEDIFQLVQIPKPLDTMEQVKQTVRGITNKYNVKSA